MIHYPRCVCRISPLLHTWCMRFEGKHNFFKRSVKNFKNITKTLAKKHQHHLAFHWENFYFQRFQFGPIKMEMINSLEGSDILTEILRLSLYSDVSTTSRVKNYGSEYHIGMFVCSGTESEMPVFKKIINVIVKDDQAFLLTSNVATLCFDDHLNAFSIEEISDAFTVICVEDLVYHRPYDRQFSYDTDDERTYIVTLYDFCF